MNHDLQNPIERQTWMAVLARAPRQRLETCLRELHPLPEYTLLRPAEVGLAMVRARTNGSGRPFNLGEITVTRCSLRTDDGFLGHAYLAGRDRRKAEHAALLDALLQADPWREVVQRRLIEPLAAEQAAARNSEAARAAATRVDFFTLARGAR